MKVYKVVINVEGYDIKSYVKEEVMASAEIGKIVDGVESPENKNQCHCWPSRREACCMGAGS